MPSDDLTTERPVDARLPVLKGPYSYATITDKISDTVLRRPTTRGWWLLFGVSGLLTLLLIYSLGYLFIEGVGIWGLNIPVAWAFAIANYVWWIALGMAGTFISAALYLTRQPWRTSINRFAEAMTLFAVSMSGIFPIIHLGRPWFFYWLAPYPDVMNVWPQWRSPLVMDFWSIIVYLLVSLMFWYMGLIPDLATLRDRAKRRWQQIGYGILALGWRGEARHWARFERAYLLMAGVAVPLVLSVHTVASLDFAMGNTPGWHSTIFPPFFVAGALFSGFALVLLLAIILRRVFDLYDYVTADHLNQLGKAVLAAGLLVAYSYFTEAFNSFYSGDPFEIYMTMDRVTGAYAPIYWSLVVLNVLIPQALWFRRVRLSTPALAAISVGIIIGMWEERIMFIITSLHRDFLPSAWHMYYPTMWDWFVLFGTIGLFILLFLLFVRFLPTISIFEVRELAHDLKKEARP